MLEKILEDELVKSRRNFLFLCVLLIFIHFGEITFSNKFNFLGAEVSVGNLGNIKLLIAVVWVYFIARYTQFLINVDIPKIPSTIREKKLSLLEMCAKKQYEKRVSENTYMTPTYLFEQISRHQFTLSVPVTISEVSKAGEYTNVYKSPIQINIFIYYWLIALAYLHFSLVNYKFLEYVMPYFIAVFTATIYILKS